MRRHRDFERARRGQRGQEQRVGPVPGIAHGLFVDDLEGGALAMRTHLRRETAARELLVLRHVLVPVAEILRRERMAVGPLVALAQMQREDASFLHVHGLEDVRLEVEIRVEADQPGVAENGHHADVLLGLHQHAPLPAVGTGGAAARGQVDHLGLLGQALGQRRQLALRHHLVQHRGLPAREVGSRCRGYQRQGHAGQCRDGGQCMALDCVDHHSTSDSVVPARTSTRWPGSTSRYSMAPASVSPGAGGR